MATANTFGARALLSTAAKIVFIAALLWGRTRAAHG
jgi:hypothetical protein